MMVGCGGCVSVMSRGGIWWISECDRWGWDVVDMCVMGGGGMWWICV